MPHTLLEAVLDQHTDCVEFCPSEGRHHLLAVGTYQLEQATGWRSGSLRVWDLSSSSPEAAERECCRADLPGVLDLRWVSRSALYVATAAGTLEAWAFSEGGKLTKQGEAVVGPDTICLSLDTDARQRTVCSTQGGGVSLFQSREAGLEEVHSWVAHEAEVWTSTFGTGLDGELVLSGADDSLLKGWDCRAPTTPVFVQRKGHGSGVCCAQSVPGQADQVVTGSYDEHLRLWDLRQLTRPLLESEVSVGGGAWRFRWQPEASQQSRKKQTFATSEEPPAAPLLTRRAEGSQRLAVACMHNGVALVDLSCTGTMKVQKQALQGTGLLYGVSWCHGELQGHPEALAMCRFYEASVSVLHF